MILILCVDDDMGLSFGGKRQSRDRVVTEDILKTASQSVLWTDEYSGKLLLADPELFTDETVSQENIKVDDACLSAAGAGEYCFVEITDVGTKAGQAEAILLYHWNRAYPSTVKFAMPEGYVLAESEEFAGNSHDKITKEVYRR